MSQTTTSSKGGKTLRAALVSMLVLSLTMIVLLAGCANNQAATNEASSDAAATETTAETTEATETTETTATTEASTEATTTAFDNNNIDFAVTFPSWNADSESLKTLVEYVKAVTDESSADYVEPADRIATFDMDGTIICEKAPFYIDWCMLLNRVLDNPSYNEADYTPSDETVKMCQDIRNTINAGEKVTAEQEENKGKLITSEFAGMTPEEYHAHVRSFAESVDAVGFEGMTYGQSFYKPMLEVIDYLKANDFDVWMVSACEREFVRALVPTVFDIAPDRIIGTDVAYVATGEGDEAYDKYNMGQDEDIVLGDPLGQETGKTGKSIAIMREIGKRPILAFGNSSGDYSMLNFAQANPDHKGMGVLVLCDDAEREYGDLDRAKEQTEEANKEGWTLFHMSDQDWATIYGEGVVKTALPGAVEAEEEVELAEAA
ncbi:MAG: haloacid dehalogenase-like hydrolase [Atopobiaceae bacterium]|nr:haloacid dehalogenase-like hydrolase [Atopobiaceae bacterium]MBR3313373.1 haloacid dehalogenase-like hydrolase [Atopobiaceae bacterium]